MTLALPLRTNIPRTTKKDPDRVFKNIECSITFWTEGVWLKIWTWTYEGTRPWKNDTINHTVLQKSLWRYTGTVYEVTYTVWWYCTFQYTVWGTVATVSCFGAILAFSKQPGTYRYILKATVLQWLLQIWLWQSNDKELYTASHIYEAFSYSVCDVKMVLFETLTRPSILRHVLHALWYSQYVQSPHGKATYHHTAVGVERYGGWYLDLQWTRDTTALHNTTSTY
jgi:hypothetical protein